MKLGSLPNLLIGFLVLTLAGCASYRQEPLVLKPPLADSPSDLNRFVPGLGMIDMTRPLPVTSVAALAVLNDPNLAAARAQQGIAAARAFAAGLLPDPVLSGSLGALLGGPGSAPAITGSITEALSALVTRGARLRAARAAEYEARARFIWQEWQVATRAETLATLLWAEQRERGILNRERGELQSVVQASRRAIAGGNLTISQGAVAAANLANLDAARNVLAQRELADHAALTALLGLTPYARLSLAPPDTAPLAPGLVPELVATLPLRRPDLIALRYGYLAANQRLRVTILAQFPGISLGVSGNSDTSRVASAGPTISLSLPIFNRNRGTIAVARATRRQLGAAFTASLASAEGGAQQAEEALELLASERALARRRLVVARRDAAGANRAYSAQSISALSYTALIDQEATRQVELVTLEQKIAAGRIALASLLALGLPTIGTSTIGTSVSHAASIGSDSHS